ncbi:LLM class flavin-dependent oxidoreductase [Kocuria sp. cx-455]|uniref:LLM class flavin-dependent oxidoreductase n=1 Tax=Kocuria sp. cx-455 TaxID=2771377 RepID=UPI0016862E75|nr:LLM class flavin-dependent oxidoreductase [Kocuria sp. cx-455]MBD2764519.1 LLM class flavin-dependent oxidoreductase [Kocuria sp. cx-455]
MKGFGFLSFGHYGSGRGPGDPDARQSLRDAVEIAEGADELGVNGAYVRVHHYARQSASPMPLLSAIAARTRNIEVGTGVIDMRYENPLYFAEEAAQLDLLADGRVALGVSRGSPEPALRGWESFGYTGSEDPRGADIAREHFQKFMRAIKGDAMTYADPAQYGAGAKLAIEPQSPGLAERIWWGAGSAKTAEWAGEQGVNLMSSTLLTEANEGSFAQQQAEQVRRFREAFRAAGHARTPRTSVSRSVFPIVGPEDEIFSYMGARESRDQVGVIDGFTSIFGRTYAGPPDTLVEQLKQDRAVMESDTLMLTIPSQLGPELNLRILENFAKYVAPELGWQPNTEGPVTGYEMS